MILRLSIDAFTATAETGAALRQIQQDRVLGKSRLSLIAGGINAAIAQYSAAGTPQVIIVEDDDSGDLLHRLDQLAEFCDASTRVLVIGGVNDIGLYRTLMARGISDYLVRPVSGRAVVDALTHLFADPQTAPRGRVVAFWGARGGVGSSSLAQNTAWTLARHIQAGVVYVDLDLAFGTSVLAFNIEAKQTVTDALAHPERLDEVLVDRCMVDYDEHLRILAALGDCHGAPPVTADSVELLIDIAARTAAMVVIDLPHLWCEWTEAVLSAADEVVVTAIPDFASLRDAKSILDLLAPRRGYTTPAGAEQGRDRAPHPTHAQGFRRHHRGQAGGSDSV